MATFKEALAVALWGIWLFASPAQPAPLDRETTAIIYNMMHALSKYKLPDIAPTVDYVSQEKLNEIVCGKNPCHQINGAQVRDKIYILDSLDMNDPYNRSILAHEFVHWFQYSSLGEAKDCPESIRREYEAYGLQNYILEKIGMRLKMPILQVCS